MTHGQGRQSIQVCIIIIITKCWFFLVESLELFSISDSRKGVCQYILMHSNECFRYKYLNLIELLFCFLFHTITICFIWLDRHCLQTMVLVWFLWTSSDCQKCFVSVILVPCFIDTMYYQDTLMIETRYEMKNKSWIFAINN